MSKKKETEFKVILVNPEALEKASINLTKAIAQILRQQMATS